MVAQNGGGGSSGTQTNLGADTSSALPTEGASLVTNSDRENGQPVQTQIVYTNQAETLSTIIPKPNPGGNVATVTMGSAVIQVIFGSDGENGRTSQGSIAATIVSHITTSASGSLSSTNPSTTGSAASISPSTDSATQENSGGGKGGNISSGAAAGIGIGAAIGGILLASAVFFLCFGKSARRKPRYDSEIPLKRPPSYGENKTPGLSQVTAIGAWNSSAEKHLPQPVPDDTISGEMSKLRSLINNHVQSYYRTSEVDLDAMDETTLGGLVDNSQTTPSALASAITNPKSRTPALRYLIAWAIFSRIGLQSHPSTTFLPLEAVSCLDSMTGLQEDEKARNALLSKWRIITATMLQPTYGSKTITDADPRAHNIGLALDDLDSVLTRLRARRDENAQRRRNLEEILKRAASFAFILFSHPSFWTFDWQANHTHEPGSVVIFPALLQVTDESGQRHSRPRTFEEMEVEPRLVA